MSKNTKSRGSRHYTISFWVKPNTSPVEIGDKIRYGMLPRIDRLRKAVLDGREDGGLHKLLRDSMVLLEIPGKTTQFLSQLDPTALGINELGLPVAPSRKEAAVEVLERLTDVFQHLLTYARWAEKLLEYNRRADWTAPVPQRPVVNYWRKVGRYVFGEIWEEAYKVVLDAQATAAAVEEPEFVEGPIDHQVLDEDLEIAELEFDFADLSAGAEEDHTEVEYSHAEFLQEAQWVEDNLEADNPAHGLVAMVNSGTMTPTEGVEAIKALRE